MLLKPAINLSNLWNFLSVILLPQNMPPYGLRRGPYQKYLWPVVNYEENIPKIPRQTLSSLNDRSKILSVSFFFLNSFWKKQFFCKFSGDFMFLN